MATAPLQRPRTMPAKVLLGWLPKEAAVQFLTSECVFDEPMNQQRAEQVWTQYHDAVESLPVRNCEAPQRVPLTREEQNIATDFMRVHQQNANVREIIKINPLNLVTHQPHVNLNQCGIYAQDAATAARYARHSL